MSTFFDRLAPQSALDIDNLSRLVYELRENRKRILDTCGVGDEAALLDGISSGTIPEHPGYEAWLGASELARSHEAARQLLAESLKEAKPK